MVVAAMIATCSAGFVACTSDDADNIPPKIEVLNGSSHVDDGATLEGDGSVTLNISVSKTDEDLNRVTIKQRVEGETFDNVEVDTTFPKLQIINDSKFERSLTANYITGKTVVLTIYAEDKSEPVQSVTLTIKLVYKAPDPVGEFVVTGPYELGAQKNASKGSFYSFSNGILLLAAANANSGKVDFVYYYDATAKATLAGPAATALETVFPSVKSWATKNPTKLGKADITVTEATTVGQFDEALAAATDTRVGNLANGDYVAYDVAGTKGLLRIVTTGTSETGAITFEIITKK
jgi:hypothetical protein